MSDKKVLTCKKTKHFIRCYSNKCHINPAFIWKWNVTFKLQSATLLSREHL